MKQEKERTRREKELKSGNRKRTLRKIDSIRQKEKKNIDSLLPKQKQ